MGTPGRYGYEAGNIAAAIANGKGFSSPFLSPETGPTAWLPPAYPYFVAGVFKAGGTFTSVSHILLDVANCIFSALIVLPVRACAKRSFSLPVADASGWLWAALPFAWWIPIEYVWDTTLTGLALTTLLWATVSIRGSGRLFHWIGHGALWAAGGLINASILALFPFYLIWVVFDRRPIRFPQRFAGAALFACLLLLIPWTIRNHRVLGKWVPLRSNFGMELWIGNNPTGEDANSFASHPVWNASEANKFQRMGEIGYVEYKEREAFAYMRSHPAATLHSMLERGWDHWFSVTDRPHARWATSPLYVRLLFAANFVMVVLSMAGLLFAFQDTRAMAIPYVIAILVFPLPYYLTHTLVRYRFPIEPVITMLCAYSLVRLFARKTAPRVTLRQTASAPEAALGPISA